MSTSTKTQPGGSHSSEPQPATSTTRSREKRDSKVTGLSRGVIVQELEYWKKMSRFHESRSRINYQRAAEWANALYSVLDDLEMNEFDRPTATRRLRNQIRQVERFETELPPTLFK